MPLVSFAELMAGAQRGGYAVGYFEPWNLESLLAILRGAEEMQAPVMVGFSGIHLPTLLHREKRNLLAFAQAARLACENARVPTSYLFNETPYWDWALASLEAGFNVTMYSSPADNPERHLQHTAELVRRANQSGVAVESELGSLEAKDIVANTDPEAAADFVHHTGVQALGVVAGNRHVVTGSFELDVDLIERLAETVPVPLVLHGGSGARDEQLRDAVSRGIRQVNYGTALRWTFLTELTKTLSEDWHSRAPHFLLGSGHQDDLMRPGFEAVGALVAEKCEILGSTEKA